jgi:coenzyme PQQ biosynthesis protein B
MQPDGALRDTGISAVLLFDSEVNHTTGLLMLREGMPLDVWCTAQVHDDLNSGFPLFRMLEHWNGGPRWNKVPATDQTSFTIPCAPALRLTAKPLLSNAPPLVMIAHGGPTSMVCPVLNPQNQFLCHQGFAVAEVNYRGSSEKASRQSLFMQGRSSGGYTALMHWYCSAISPQAYASLV